MSHTTNTLRNKSAFLCGLIVLMAIFGLKGQAFAQNGSDDGWSESRLFLYTVNAEMLFHPSSGGGPFQNMAYGFKIGRSTVRRFGWYLGAMTNFKFFGAFKSADLMDVYPGQRTTSFFEVDLGLTLHQIKPLSWHLGTGFFYRTNNYLDHDYRYVHLKGQAAAGLAATTGFTWHVELSDKYIREKNPNKLSLTAEFVSLFNLRGSSASDRFSYGLKLGIGLCSAIDYRYDVPLKPETPAAQETAPPVIAQETKPKKDKEETPETHPAAQTPEKETPRAQEPASTHSKSYAAPVVEIGRASDITEYSLNISGLLREEGSETVTKRGFCYSRYGNPTLSNNAMYVLSSDSKIFFENRIADLKPGTTYSVRAFAINGVDTVYSDLVTVTTKELVSLNATSIYDLQPTSAKLVFVVSGGSSPEVRRRGICYADSAVTVEPTLEDHVVVHQTGAVSLSINSLESDKRYYVRAFTEKSDGTVDYSEPISFVTPLYLSTIAVRNIGVSTATAGGTIQHNIPETVVQAGSCWSLKNPLPTTNNTRTEGDAITNGLWQSSMVNLRPGTTYYVRAYIVTSSGAVYYGNVVTFKTKAE